ncbi:hypothetical protein ACF073_06145 [Streptomyces sp. NPDC015171]|uniref:hypothetical protein n=1 Tax=Streptomyces sp. NPDC015171 TaxID=3364945 RepID=UPI0036F52F1A
MCTAPARSVRGAVGEDCVVPAPDPPWKRSLAVYARVRPTGAARAFVDLLRATWPVLRAPGPYEECARPAAPAR